MKWEINHRTRYTYASPVRGNVNEVRLQPVHTGEQSLESFDLKITPAAALASYHDFYSNDVHRFEVSDSHDTLLIESRSVVTTHAPPLLDSGARPASFAQLKDAATIGRCYDFMLPSRFVDAEPDTWRLAVDATQGETDVWQCALRLMHFTHSHLAYQTNSTHVHTHMREALAQKRGVCQDFAHITLGLCRAMKIPALYVSGYLATENASATHAWIEVFIPGHGWRGLDPTHNRQTDDTYIKLAVGRDYGDVPPVSGHYKGTSERKMEVEVKITRSPESAQCEQLKSGRR